MISRHLLRIKIFQSIYSLRKSGDDSFKSAHSQLNHSIQKSYHVYLLLLLLLIDIKHYAFQRIDLIKSRVIKDDKEWQKLERLVNNKLIEQLEQNKSFKSVIANEKITWTQNENVVKDIYKLLIDSQMYIEYRETEQTYDGDKKILRKLYDKIIPQNEGFFSFLEENSIFWNDDLDHIISMAGKTFHKFSEDVTGGGSIFPIYSDEDAKQFTELLFTNTLKNWDTYSETINLKLKNWEQDRIADSDIILLQMAVNEAVLFTEIPVKVTLNEYIELSKLYSTEKSNVFINGILHSIFEELTKQKIIVKNGRGLLN